MHVINETENTIPSGQTQDTDAITASPKDPVGEQMDIDFWLLLVEARIIV